MTKEEQSRGLLSQLPTEAVKALTAYAEALLYDQDHPGENTAELVRQEQIEPLMKPARQGVTV